MGVCYHPPLSLQDQAVSSSLGHAFPRAGCAQPDSIPTKGKAPKPGHLPAVPGRARLEEAAWGRWLLGQNLKGDGLEKQGPQHWQPEAGQEGSNVWSPARRDFLQVKSREFPPDVVVGLCTRVCTQTTYRLTRLLGC